MSMCFYHEGVVYADRFQVRDYVNFVGGLTDQKIFVCKKSKIVYVCMGIVPESIKDVFEKLRVPLTLIKHRVKKSDPEDTKILEQIRDSIRSLQLMGMIFFNVKNKILGFDCGPILEKEKQVVNVIDHNESLIINGSKITFELLRLGKTPTDIFKAHCLLTGVISKEYTAFDLKQGKFLPTNF